MVINELIELWKENKKRYVKESTYSAYCLLAINHIAPYFGEKEDFVEEDVQEFVLSKLDYGLSEKTIKDIIVVIGMIQKYAVKNKLLTYHPIDIEYPISSKQKGIQVMSRDNQKYLLTYLLENFSFKNLGIIICLCTGLRIGELCALKWNDIDMDQNLIKIRRSLQRIYMVDEEKRYTRIHIGTPKTKESNREIPMSTELLKIIKPLMKVVNLEYYVLSNDEKPTEPRTYRNYYKRVLKKIGLPYLKFHGLRHSFATRCIESKSSVKTISVILGHANITTTLNLYVHPDNKEKKRCIDKMLKEIL